MPNTINYAKRFTTLMDETFKLSAKTGVLESPAEWSRAGANVNEIIVPKYRTDGLADYDRNDGYVSGNVSVTWETLTFNYERGRMFTVDNMDNEETINIAFGRLAGEFIRKEAAPELDAFRFAQYASTAGIPTKSATLTTGTQVVGALRDAVNELDEAEVPESERLLFITPTLYGMLDDMDTYKSKLVMSRFSQVISVPQNRFYTEIKLNDGKTAGETAGGYTKTADSKNINFLIIYKPAVVQFTKHVAPKIITPAENQDADAWKYGYRIYGIAKILEEKYPSVYCSYVP